MGESHLSMDTVHFGGTVPQRQHNMGELFYHRDRTLTMRYSTLGSHLTLDTLHLACSLLTWIHQNRERSYQVQWERNILPLKQHNRGHSSYHRDSTMEQSALTMEISQWIYLSYHGHIALGWGINLFAWRHYNVRPSSYHGDHIIMSILYLSLCS